MEDILLKIGEYLVDPTIRQLRYLFHFKSIVEDLKKESEKLRSKQATLQHDVRIAEQKTEEIKEDVRKWLSNVEGVMKEVQNLEEKIRIDKHCLCGRCPNMIWRYNLGKDAMKKTATIREFHDEKFDRISYRTKLELIPSQETHFESTKSAFDQIMEALESDECNMIGLYGTGGVGKTTLAEGVRERAKELKLFDNLVKVVVSQNPNFTKIQDDIADWLEFKIEEKGDEARASRLFSRLKKEKKILIILDDVWGKLNLAKDIGIPFGDDQKGCKILITTRSLHVCDVMGSQKNVPLNALSKEDAWALFKKSSGLDDNSPTLTDVAVKVAGECKGLPLAIVAVGSALKGKTLEQYKQAFKKLKSSKLVEIENVDKGDKGVYGSLQLSYDYLNGKETKLCFLLCSLFPEDYPINIEDLVRYGMGLDLFEDVDSIEDARSQLRAIIKTLKDSSLLLETSQQQFGKMHSSLLLEASQQQFVKMHDVVRDVALWIASKGENVFMVRAGVGLQEWPNEERFEQYTAISLMANKIEVLPSKLDCPRLEILLLGGEDSLIVPEMFFEGMKALKVLTLSHGSLPPQSLEFLTNLRMLKLEDCKFEDISSLGKLKRLQVLSFYGSYIEELPNEVGELNNLRLLDLVGCRKLKRIPPDVIQQLSLLEELYIGSSSFKEWEIKGSSLERRNASISELNSLSCLAVVSMELNPECLPQGFSFHNLHRYDICLQSTVDSYFGGSALDYPQSRKLGFYSIDVSSKVNAFKELFPTVEYLNLKNATGFKNVIPNMYQGSLKDLISLSLVSCGEMECLIDSTQLRGPTQHVSLQSLRDVEVSYCQRLTCLFSSSLARSLVQLQKLQIEGCEGLEQIIITEKEDEEISSEAHLQPFCFPKLTTLKIKDCAKLKYTFPISVTQDLQLLEELIIFNAPQLKQVFGHKREEDGNDILLPQLRKLEPRTLSSPTSFYEGNYHWKWPSLQQLTVVKCPKLSTSFIIDLEANLSALQKQLRVLRIGNRILLAKANILLQRQSLQNLEDLTIENCEGVEEIFHGISTDRDDELPVVSNLKVLRLRDVPEVRVIWKGPTQISSFQNLTFIWIVNCNKLKHIFSPSVARNLQRLEDLIIEGCEELERMIGEDEEDEIISLKPHLQQQPIRFPNLKRIWVRDCNKLKSLFPITIARGLPQLDRLWVERASELEEVFRHENEEHLRDENKILLQQLFSLKLEELPRLISFCPGGYHFIFPSLNWLTVRECPNITTSFTMDSDRSVHAKVKAKAETPQLVKEDMPEGSSTPQATVAAMPSHDNKFWCRGAPQENSLPPYMEVSSGNL